MSQLLRGIKLSKTSTTVPNAKIQERKSDSDIKISLNSKNIKGSDDDSNNQFEDNDSMAKVLRRKLLNNQSLVNNRMNNPSNCISNVSYDNDVETLRKIEKLHKEDDLDLNLKNNILRLGDKYEFNKSIFRGNTGADEEEDIDMSLYKSMNSSKRISEPSKIVKSNIKCDICDNNSRYLNSKNYVICKWQYCMLRLKNGSKRLHDMHCEILPLDHLKCFRDFDAEMIDEVLKMKSKLTVLLASFNLIPIFMESAVNFSRFPHAIIDCVPIDIQLKNDVTFCFTSAFKLSIDVQESRCIFLNKDKSLHSAIPKDFEYLLVEWELNNENGNSGIISLVSSFKYVDEYFCLDTIAGLLEQDCIKLKLHSKIDNVVENYLINKFIDSWKKQ